VELLIINYLSLAFEETYRTGEKTVTNELITSLLSRQIDDLESSLTKHCYNIKNLAKQFNTKPAEIRLLFKAWWHCSGN